mgnify:CR=1 FL=1
MQDRTMYLKEYFPFYTTYANPLLYEGERMQDKEFNLMKSYYPGTVQHIQEKIEFDDSLVDYSKEGVYPVRISVTNSSNLSTSETLYLTIYSLDSIESEKNWFFIPILLVGVGLIGAIGIGFYLYKKRRNCNKSENNL